MDEMKRFYCLFVAMFVALSVWGGPSSVGADISMTEANRPYSVRFEDWVLLYLNNEFLSSAPPAPDYNISARPTILGDKVKFVITGYYFDTKLGRDWYSRYGSQLQTTIAMLCHTWTQQGHPVSLDDFEINIRKEPVNQ